MTNKHKKKYSSGSGAPVTEPGDLFFNILPFEHSKKQLEITFTDQFHPDRQRFAVENLPPEVGEYFAVTKRNSAGPLYVYSGFKAGDSGCPVILDPAAYPAVAKAYYTRKIRDLLVPKTAYFRSNFLNDTQFWCIDKTEAQHHCNVFHKYTLRVQYDDFSGHPELLISYDGRSFLLSKSLDDLTDDERVDPEWITSVAWDGKIYPRMHLPKKALYRQDKVYPVLNLKLAEALEIPNTKLQVTDGYQRCYRKIKTFYRHHCSDVAFRAIIPHHGKWKQVPETRTGRMQVSERQLEFGQGKKGTDPYDGLKDFGPLKLPKGKQFCYFFIYRKDDEEAAKNLYAYILSVKGFVRMNRLTRIPMHYKKDKNIVIPTGGDPEVEVRSALETTRFEPGVKYFAYYVSPYSRYTDDLHKKAVYYRIKEMLLYRQISMQTVVAENLFSDFKYAMTNIAIALIAKLGGVPWRLEGGEQRDLVIGFGAYRNRNFGVKYTGSAVCFSSGGLFREFDVFPADHTLAIAGAAVDAFKSYRERYPEARQMTIHFYKRMSRRELEPLEKMLEELQLDIPVVVAGISKSPVKSLLAFDAPEKCVMPPDGTWVQTGKDKWLLNINQRKTPAQTAVKQSMPVKITLQCNKKDYLKQPGMVECLLAQIYAFGFMHWRSVRQPSLPVTVTYPEYIASFMPWFKNKFLPPHGRTVPWFL